VLDPQTLDDERLTVMGLLAETWTGLAARGAVQLAEFGLSPVEFEVMIRLARSPMGLLRMTDLSAQTSLTTSGVTRVVDRLVDRGLVTRQACATDRRTTYAVVTDAGRDLLAAALPGHLALIETWLMAPLRDAGGGEGVDRGDLESFVAALRRLRDHVVPCATAGSEGPLAAAPVGSGR
jgi:DNA-binding MarR family transcriptional regulator